MHGNSKNATLKSKKPLPQEKKKYSFVSNRAIISAYVWLSIL